MMAPSQGVSAFIALWWAGFREACCLGRVYTICKRSRTVRFKIAQCFVNGLLVLGSVLVLQMVIAPLLSYILQVEQGSNAARHFSSFLIAAYYVLWLYPIYVLSFLVNWIRSTEIAEHVFTVLKLAPSVKPVEATSSKHTSSTVAAIDSFTLGVGEQLYSVIVISAFFAEAFAASFIPYVGQVLYFLLLSWLYAYYCFEYKWSLAQWSLERRLVFFESNWAFFFGFGSPCVLATFFFSPLVSTGIAAILYPLFVVIATASDPEQLVDSVYYYGALPRLPLFYLPNHCTLPLLHYLYNKFRFMRKDP